MNALLKIAQQRARQLIGIALFSGLVLPAVVSANPPPTANSVQNVETTILPGGKVMVRVNLKQALSATPAGFTVANPPRIALDLPDTGNAIGKNMVQANLGPLTSVNVVQAGTRTRLVLNLNKSVEYETKLEGNALLIALGEVGAGVAPVNVSPQFAEPGPVRARHAVRDVDFRRGDQGEARIVATLSDPQIGINIRQQATGIVVDFIGTDLPNALQRRMDVSDFGTTVQAIETYALGDNVRMVIQPRGGWEYSAYQTDSNFIVEVKPADDAQKKTADGKVKYVGEKLSLNFQNVEVRSVLQVIADFTGLNIIASDTVTGNLTLRLKDVPWDQALDLIIQTKGLDKRQNGNVIWVAPKDEIFAKEKQEFEAKLAVADLEPLVTEHVQLNYMRADQAQRMLYGFAGRAASAGTSARETVNCSAQAQGLTGVAASVAQASQQTQGGNDQKVLTKRGRATHDLTTNTLIITDTARKIQEVRQLISRLDVPARQVMIEARVVIADSNWSRELGVRLGTRLFKNTGRDSIGVGGTLNESATIAAGGTPTVTPQVGLATLGTAAGQIAFSLLNPSTGNLLSLELSALEADNRGKILSNPRVMTTNQKPAVILNGTQIPFITPGTANSPATVTFKDAFLCLLVDPQILNNDTLIMTVEVQKDAVDTSNAAVGAGINAPAIATRRIKTQVRVNNGETLVLGGIFDQTELNNVGKVPFFGDIPVLGNLFKRTDRQDRKTELIVFITPRILDERLSLR
mgnify:CR=1 FL=1